MSHAVLKQAKSDLAFVERQLEHRREEFAKAEKDLAAIHKSIINYEAAVARSVRMLKAVEAAIESEASNA